MPTPRALSLLPALLALVACEPSRPRAPEPSPPTSRPSPAHGWVELSLLDTRVPASEGDGGGPPVCRVELEIGGRPLIAESVASSGSGAPYRAQARHRAVAPPGRHRVSLYYVGCRFYGDQADVIESSFVIDVLRGRVTRVRFDGASVVTDPPFEPGTGSP